MDPFRSSPIASIGACSMLGEATAILRAMAPLKNDFILALRWISRDLENRSFVEMAQLIQKTTTGQTKYVLGFHLAGIFSSRFAEFFVVAHNHVGIKQCLYCFFVVASILAGVCIIIWMYPMIWINGCRNQNLNKQQWEKNIFISINVYASDAMLWNVTMMFLRYFKISAWESL